MPLSQPVEACLGEINHKQVGKAKVFVFDLLCFFFCDFEFLICSDEFASFFFWNWFSVKIYRDSRTLKMSCMSCHPGVAPAGILGWGLGRGR